MSEVVENITFEAIKGPEGTCLAVGVESVLTRIAGPKPWGGGITIHKWEVRRADLLKEIGPSVRLDEVVVSREGFERRLGRLIDKMLDYDLFADPEDVERQRVIACDLIRIVQDAEGMPV